MSKQKYVDILTNGGFKALFMNLEFVSLNKYKNVLIEYLHDT